MRWLLALFITAALAAEPPVDIDPNTKTQGGADVRGSDASAGGQSHPGQETEKSRADERREVAAPDKENIENDKPISARKPREQDRESDSAAKGESPKQ